MPRGFRAAVAAGHDLWPQHSGCQVQSSFFLLGAGTRVDEDQLDEWPEVFPQAPPNKSLLKKLMEAVKGALGVGFGDKTKKLEVNPADLDLYVKQATEAADRAAVAAKAASEAAGLSFVRERSTAGAVREADEAWAGTLQAVKVAAAQREADKALQQIQESMDQASMLTTQGIKEAEEAITSHRTGWGRDKMMWQAEKSLHDADKALPDAKAHSLMRKRQKQLQEEISASLRGPGLLPPLERNIDSRLPAPEAALETIEGA